MPVKKILPLLGPSQLFVLKSQFMFLKPAFLALLMAAALAAQTPPDKAKGVVD